MNSTTQILGQKYEETESITVPVQRFKDAIGAECLDEGYRIHIYNQPDGFPWPECQKIHESITGHTMTLFGVKTERKE